MIPKAAILVAYLVALLVETILCLHVVVVAIIRERTVSLRLSVLGEACVRKRLVTRERLPRPVLNHGESLHSSASRWCCVGSRVSSEVG